ncbi:MAG: 30S ribosomal protein S2 [Patescibacteria group bacterium]
MAKLAEKTGVHYLNYKVPGGVLTNFDTLLSRIRSMNQLREYIQGQDFQKLTKKEKLVKERQLAKLEVVYK